jgi:hypothetical protein
VELVSVTRQRASKVAASPAIWLVIVAVVAAFAWSPNATPDHPPENQPAVGADGLSGDVAEVGTLPRAPRTVVGRHGDGAPRDEAVPYLGSTVVAAAVLIGVSPLVTPAGEHRPRAASSTAARVRSSRAPPEAHLV